MPRRLSLPLLAILPGLLLACQSKAPATAPQSDGAASGLTTLVRSELRESTLPLMAARVEFDPASGLASLTPHRLGQAGSPDVLEAVDILQYFISAPCTSCLKIVGIGQSPAGNPVLEISVRHPFASPAPGAQQREDLAVFNVEAIVRFDETGQTLTAFPGLGASAVTSTRLVNADGYTGTLDAAHDTDYNATAATIHPYRMFFRDYSTGTFDPSNEQGFPDYRDIRGYLAMGQGQGPDVQPFEFALPHPGAQVRFDLILQGAFGNSSGNVAQRKTPEYRLPQYNKKAASEVRVAVSKVVPGNLSGRGLLGQVSTSAAQLRINVLDITDSSTGVTVGANRDQLRAASDVARFDIEIPGILTAPIAVADPAGIREGGVGNDPADPLRYAIGVSNQASAPDGRYYGVIKVLDSCAAGQNSILPEDAQRYSTPGFTEPFAIAEMATWALFPVDVAPNLVTRLSDADTGAAFGSSLAVGDFNGDGVPDLAAGAIQATPGGVSNAGQVYVYYQLPNGQFPPPITLQEPVPQVNVRFGFALAAGDITGDGLDDLLASATNPNIPGRVQVFRSRGLGFLAPVTVQDLSLANGSRYGWALATTDVDGDGRQDAIITVPEALGSFSKEGKIYRYIGTPSGLASPQIVSPPSPQTNGYFGISVAVLNKPDGAPERIAIGMPGHDSAKGRVYAYAISGVGGLVNPVLADPVAPATDANFGYALAALDANGDGLMDLAIGQPGPGGSGGVVQLALQPALGGDFLSGGLLPLSLPDTFTFGLSLAVGDLTGAGGPDLAIGAPVLDAGPTASAGLVAMFPGAKAPGADLIFGAPNPSNGMFFGRHLTVLPRPGARDRLLVASSGDDPDGKTDAGAVYVY